MILWRLEGREPRLVALVTIIVLAQPPLSVVTDFSLCLCSDLLEKSLGRRNGGACTMLIAARFAALSAWSAVGCGGGGGPGATRVSGIGPVFMHVLKVSARTSAAIRCAFYSCHVGRRSFLQLEVLGACGPLWTSLRAWRSRHAVSGSLRVGSRLQRASFPCPEPAYGQLSMLHAWHQQRVRAPHVEMVGRAGSRDRQATAGLGQTYGTKKIRIACIVRGSRGPNAYCPTFLILYPHRETTHRQPLPVKLYLCKSIFSCAARPSRVRSSIRLYGQNETRSKVNHSISYTSCTAVWYTYGVWPLK